MGRGRSAAKQRRKAEKKERKQQKKHDVEQQQEAAGVEIPMMKKQNRGYQDYVKENANFESFYKKQNIVPEKEWDVFMDCLRSPLPSSFRVTGSRNQAGQLINLIQNNFFKDLNVTVGDKLMQPPKCLDWYPDNLAWQLDASRVVIRSNETLKKLQSFLVSESESGNISRQEAVSMIPPLLMDIKSHHKILDMCAAPGSKTAQLIEYLHDDTDEPMPEGFVIGNDSENKRCYLMVHQVKRLHSPNFMITNHDASRLPNLQMTNHETGKLEPVLFDRILCDVPCSGDGTIRKNPEVWRKWHTGNGMNLHNVQMRIVQRGLELLAVGGRLVYSTCSFNPIENEAVLCAVLNKCEGSVKLLDCSNELKTLKRLNGLSRWQVATKDGQWYETFECVPEKFRSIIRPSMFPPVNVSNLNIQYSMRIVPHQQNTGGFFIAVLEKTARLPWMKQETVASETSADKTSMLEVMGAQNQSSENNIEPPPKKIKYAGFREDPFYYLKDDDSNWPSIKEFYSVADSFDPKLLMVRSLGKEKNRNIYLSSPSTRNIIMANDTGKVKFVNTGVKIFCRSEHAMCKCSFRLVQDGAVSFKKYMNSRQLTIQKADVLELLSQENPYLTRMTASTRVILQTMGIGGLLYTYIHTDSTGLTSKISMTGWLGKTSCRVYVSRWERQHYLRLCGVDPDQIMSAEVQIIDNDEDNDSEKGETKLELGHVMKANETQDQPLSVQQSNADVHTEILVSGTKHAVADLQVENIEDEVDPSDASVEKTDVNDAQL